MYPSVVGSCVQEPQGVLRYCIVVQIHEVLSWFGAEASVLIYCGAGARRCTQASIVMQEP
jgi:hypothetical protein